MTTEDYLRDLIHQLVLHYPEWPHTMWVRAKEEAMEYSPRAAAMRDVTLRTHLPHKCRGQFCCIHNPSPHHMRDWPLVWNERKNLMERVCEHNLAHPDPDDATYKRRAGLTFLTEHECDGCCNPPETLLP